MIVTFYSFKGGVGRSMALVNVGEILAERGYRVILCDWDLEAPGLERYLTGREVHGAPWAETLDRLIASPGLVDLLSDYRDSLAEPRPVTAAEEEDYAKLGKIMVRKPSAAVVPVPRVGGSSSRAGSLSLLTAGRRDGGFQQSYAAVVRSFDWEEFYSRWAGGSYIEFLRRDLVGDAQSPGAADILLVDSRTGVSEQGGVCTHHLADLVVLMTAANDANLAGIHWMAEGLSDDRLESLRGGRKLQVLPVASRIEQTSQKEELVDFRRRFTAQFKRYFSRASGVTQPPKTLALTTEIPYMPFYAFTERVVAREPEDEREDKLYTSYEMLADVIVANGVERDLLPVRSGQGAIVARRRPPTKRKELSVYMSVPRTDSPLAMAIVDGLSKMRIPVSLRGEPDPALFRRFSRFLVLAEGEETPSQRAEVAEAIRQTALRADVRVLRLQPSYTAHALEEDDRGLILPAAVSAVDAELFESLSDEISAETMFRPSLDRIGLYPGNQPFDEARAASFFGRDRELAEIGTWTGGWLDVGGASGVGKTSFVLAGIMPMIRRGQLRGIPEGIRVVKADAAPSLVLDTTEPALLLLDNCERLDALTDDELRRLWAPVDSALARGAWHVITIARGENPLVGKVARPGSSIVLTELSREGAREALNAPAVLSGITWEKGLIDRVVADLAPEAGSGIDPSLLAIVAADLAHGAEKGQITHEQYDRRGGAGGRLSDLFSEVLASTRDGSRVRGLLTRLLPRRGGAHAHLSPRMALYALGLPDPQQFLERLASLRLIAIGHEVTLRHPKIPVWWPPLRQWAAADAERVDVPEMIHGAHALWIATGESDAALPRGRALELLTREPTAEPEAREFLQRARTRQQRRRWTIATSAVMILLLFLASAYVVTRYARKQAVKEERLAVRRARADMLATGSLQITNDDVSALVSAIAAGEQAETPKSSEALRKAVQRSRLRLVLAHDGPVLKAMLDVGGRKVTSLDVDDTMRVWSVADTKLMATIPYESGFYQASEFSGDGGTIVVSTYSGIVRVWDGGREPTDLQAGGDISAIATTLDGGYVAAATGSQLRLWSVARRTETLIDGSRPYNRLIFLSNDALIGAASNGDVVLWTDFRGPERPAGNSRVRPTAARVFAHANGVSSMALSHGQNYVVTTGTQFRNARLWQIARSFSTSGRTTYTLSRAPWLLTAKVPLFAPRDAFGNNDSLLMLRGTDGLHIWPTQQPEKGLTIPGQFSAAAFHPAHPRLVAGSSDGEVLIYFLSETGDAVRRKILLRGHTGVIRSLAFVDDGRQIISASDDGTVRLWWADDVTIPQKFSDLLALARSRLPNNLTPEQQAILLNR